MSSPAFEVALAHLYTDAPFREQFLRDPTVALAHFDLTAAERADLAAIDRAGLVMAAASYSAKRAHHARRGRLIARLMKLIAWKADGI
jgi:hypothetical protein